MIAAGGSICTVKGELFTFGKGTQGRLGHGGTQNELVRRLAEALAGKKVVGAAAGEKHTAVCTNVHNAVSSSPLGLEAGGGRGETSRRSLEVRIRGPGQSDSLNSFSARARHCHEANRHTFEACGLGLKQPLQRHTTTPIRSYPV